MLTGTDIYFTVLDLRRTDNKISHLVITRTQEIP